MNTDPNPDCSDYSALTSAQRRTIIMDMVGKTMRIYNVNSVYSDSLKSYIQICHSRSLSLMDRFGFHADTGRHAADCPKLHINCKSSCIPALVESLMYLQDELVTEPDAETKLQRATFIFKVLCGPEGFQQNRPDHGWPPRIVIYPSLLLMYPQISKGDRSLDMIALKNLITMIETNLNNVKDWDDTNYRARYFHRLSSNVSDSIEIVVGSTILMGDRSNR